MARTPFQEYHRHCQESHAYKVSAETAEVGQGCPWQREEHDRSPEAGGKRKYLRIVQEI